VCVRVGDKRERNLLPTEKAVAASCVCVIVNLCVCVCVYACERERVRKGVREHMC